MILEVRLKIDRNSDFSVHVTEYVGHDDGHLQHRLVPRPTSAIGSGILARSELCSLLVALYIFM